MKEKQKVESAHQTNSKFKVCGFLFLFFMFYELNLRTQKILYIQKLALCEWQAFKFDEKQQIFLRMQITQAAQAAFCHHNSVIKYVRATVLQIEPLSPSASLPCFHLSVWLLSCIFVLSFNFHFFPLTFTFYIFLFILPPFLICWGVFSLSISLVRSVPPALLNLGYFPFVFISLSCSLWIRQ